MPRRGETGVGYWRIQQSAIFNERKVALLSQPSLGDIRRCPRRRHDESKGALPFSRQRNQGGGRRRIQGLPARAATPLLHRRRFVRLVLASANGRKRSRPSG